MKQILIILLMHLLLVQEGYTNNQGNFSILANNSSFSNGLFTNYYKFFNDSTNLLTMNWKANTANTAATYDAQITVTGSTITNVEGMEQ